ncbi:hypothetical protein [Methylophaga sp. OBS1]|uniref:hypothetical protein n=1 Tax=Methylophaga sp. OBS1 TaxID=2991933 RepID=UPI002253B911|nr:hypothetical protein [Methylophaga sp. OBS1]MCX4193165.1 hypothetical protein [Methylophaga sp. OBS1]
MQLAWMISALIVLLLVVVVWLLSRRKQNAAAPAPKPVNPYAAVKIKPIKHEACEAAYEASCRIFLAREAPTLPLRDCGKPNDCRCSYVHYKDRRHERRRSSNIQTQELHIEGYPTERERRDTVWRGRRKTD